ncbi:hypothetical protein BDV98DRAFT_565386 [Pterulicium gracile]|uniref:Uncharacterized protein n=1 Tax=Pterulicium gracile TaxID=1884261 RepID=A0A5C3QMF3_9AGAR|nr:hypothetical protein BDV98DRAFT_565386 [Pterula gracilis]
MIIWYSIGVATALFVQTSAASLRHLSSTTLGVDPDTMNHLNGESFQQDALVTWSGWQYAAFWTPSATDSSVRHITLSRRSLSENSTEWDTFSFDDYNQTHDDGHNTISLGISRGDSSLHFIFDQHNSPLNYRSSIPGLAAVLGDGSAGPAWGPESFTETQSVLSMVEEALDPEIHFINITYPRFLATPSNVQSILPGMPDLLLEFRVGRAGIGDDWLYKYLPSTTSGEPGVWELVGKYLQGVNNNAYINGLDFDYQSNLHATWTYRDFIFDNDTGVAVQAGPNGPENNHDLVYAHSPDLGATWYNSWGQPIATTVGSVNATTGSGSDNTTREADPGRRRLSESVVPTSPGVTVFSIPKYGGILNQEAQTVDWEGRVHVLNRENSTGTQQWYHYYRTPNVLTPEPASASYWFRAALPLNLADDPNSVTNTPAIIGKRGKLVFVSSSSNLTEGVNATDGTTLLALLPSNAPNSTAFSILAANSWNDFTDWETVWSVEEGCGWEPLFDRERIQLGGPGTGEEKVLSLFMVNGTAVQVWDLVVEA